MLREDWAITDAQKHDAPGFAPTLGVECDDGGASGKRIVAVSSRDFFESATGPIANTRNGNFYQELISVQCRRKETREEFIGGNPPIVPEAPCPQPGLKSHGHGWQLCGGIGMREASTHGASVANREVRNERHRFVEKRCREAHERTAFNVTLTGQPTQNKLPFFLFDVRELANLIDIDEHGRSRETEVHCRNQTLPARKRFGLITVFGQKVEPFFKRFRAIVPQTELVS